MSKYLRVKDWDKYQHYKDRNPPWIKLDTQTFTNYDFASLHDASKLLAVCIWTLASRSKDPKLGLIPNDLEYIKRQCNLSDFVKPQHLKELILQGYIIDDSDMLASCKQVAIPETYSKEAYSKEAETKSKAKVSLDELSVDHIAEWLAKKRLQGKYINHNEHDILETFKNYVESKQKKGKPLYENFIAAYRNSFEWDSNQPKTRLSPDKHQRTLEAATRGHIRAKNLDF